MHSVGSFRMPPVLVRSRSRLLRLSAQRPMVMFPCRGSRPMQAGSLSFFRKRPQGCRLISINSPPGARLCGDSEFRQHPQGPCRRLETLCRLGPTLKPFFPSAKPPSASTLPRASVGLLNLETFCFPDEIAELAESRSETAQGADDASSCGSRTQRTGTSPVSRLLQYGTRRTRPFSGTLHARQR